MRLTLHEAQERVAAIFRREGWGDPKIDWSSPVAAALAAHLSCRSAAPLTRYSIAWGDIRGILLAYQAHLDFEAGKAFADGRRGPERDFVLADGQAHEVHR